MPVPETQEKLKTFVYIKYDSPSLPRSVRPGTASVICSSFALVPPFLYLCVFLLLPLRPSNFPPEGRTPPTVRAAWSGSSAEFLPPDWTHCLRLLVAQLSGQWEDRHKLAQTIRLTLLQISHRFPHHGLSFRVPISLGIFYKPASLHR